MSTMCCSGLALTALWTRSSDNLGFSPSQVTLETASELPIPDLHRHDPLSGGNLFSSRLASLVAYHLLDHTLRNGDAPVEFT